MARALPMPCLYWPTSAFLSLPEEEEVVQPRLALSARANPKAAHGHPRRARAVGRSRGTPAALLPAHEARSTTWEHRKEPPVFRSGARLRPELFPHSARGWRLRVAGR